MKLHATVLLYMMWALLAGATNVGSMWLRSLPMPTMAKEVSSLDIARAELNAWRGKPVDLSIDASMGEPFDQFAINKTSNSNIQIKSPSEIGLLYGVYKLLMMQEMGIDVPASLVEAPKSRLRMLNHWDNLDGTIERGYAGSSIWQWDSLPKINQQYVEYARHNASIGINGVVLNNVNASPKMLSGEYLPKIAALADVMRPYGIKTYISVNFASPMALDSLATADPLDAQVAEWWKQKVDEIYALIPDFGGFLVKANSEGQPGPCDFGRSHAEGANMLGRALKPYGGLVIWRAFVYSPNDADRAKQAYIEFQPLDGKFEDNVRVQVKNGPIDFQPREPYSPLFDGMEQTPLMAELQITQEYLGHSNHLVFLAPMWREFFQWIDLSKLDGMAGVSNLGSDSNWTGYTMAQANWYAFGRMAWAPDEDPRKIAEEWIKLTLQPEDEATVDEIAQIMMQSHGAAVDYMMPLGLHHIFAWGHHYGPEPWCEVEGARADWLPKYYHQADSIGIGFDRSATGSNAVEQYRDEFASQVASLEACPEEYILWFHHVPWTHKMPDGTNLWETMCNHYQRGVDTVEKWTEAWRKVQGKISPELYEEISDKLTLQLADAKWWRDGCILYFQQFSNMPIPKNVQIEHKSLTNLMKVSLKISNFEAPKRELLDSVR